MPRQDQEYWQRLRKDTRSSAAVGLAVIAGLATAMAFVELNVPGTQYQQRENPLYWLLLVPFTIWGGSLTSFEPGPIATLRPSFIILPILAGIALLWAHSIARGLTAFVVILTVAIVCSLGGELLYRGSMLKLEGPAR